MKSYSSIYKTIFFFTLLFCCLVSNASVQAACQPRGTSLQAPSLEVYPTGCTPYPSVDNVVVDVFITTVTVSAEVADVSAVASVVAKFKDLANPGVYMHSEIMYDDGANQDGADNDGIYGTIFNIGTWPAGTYTVDILATDILGNSNIYVGVGTMTVLEHPILCNTKNGAQLCIIVSPATSLNNISSFTVSPSTGPVGTMVTLTANLSGIPNETITFRDDTGNLTLASVVTNASGIATFDYQPSFTGTHTLEAVYAGNLGKGYAPSFKTASLVLTGNCSTKNGATICASTSFVKDTTAGVITSFTSTPSSTSAGTTVTLSVASSLPANETITFRDDTGNLTLTSVVTNASGAATFQYQPTFSGTHTIEAIYAGNMGKEYAPSFKTTPLTVTGNCNTKNGAAICVGTSQSPTHP